MLIKEETNLCDFTFWSGGRDNARLFTLDELETIGAVLEDCHPEGVNATELNDLFWFEPELLAEWVGIELDELHARGEK